MINRFLDVVVSNSTSFLLRQSQNLVVQTQDPVIAYGASSSIMATFLSMPREIRFLIYDHLIKCTGVLEIFAQYDIAKKVDQDTISLMHACRTTRTEVQDHFYKHQAFRFASSQAFDKFLSQIGPYHTSLITNVHIGPNLSRKVLDNLVIETIAVLRNRITSLERLTIERPQYGYIRSTYPDGLNGSEVLRPGPKTQAILSACPQLARGNIVKKLVGPSYDEDDEDAPDQEFLLFVPKDEKFPAQHKNQVGHVHWPDIEKDPVFQSTFFNEVLQFETTTVNDYQEAVAGNNGTHKTGGLISCVDDTIEKMLDPTGGPCLDYHPVCMGTVQHSVSVDGVTDNDQKTELDVKN